MSHNIHWTTQVDWTIGKDEIDWASWNKAQKKAHKFAEAAGDGVPRRAMEHSRKSRRDKNGKNQGKRLTFESDGLAFSPMKIKRLQKPTKEQKRIANRGAALKPAHGCKGATDRYIDRMVSEHVKLCYFPFC
jgi:hypothetical protein